MLSNFVTLNGVVPSSNQNINANQNPALLGMTSNTMPNSNNTPATIFTQPFLTSHGGPTFGTTGPHPFATAFTPTLQPGLLPYMGNFVTGNAAVSSHLQNTIMPHVTPAVAGQQPSTFVFTSPNGSSFINPLNISQANNSITLCPPNVSVPSSIAIAGIPNMQKPLMHNIQPVAKPLTQSAFPDKILKKLSAKSSSPAQELNKSSSSRDPDSLNKSSKSPIAEDHINPSSEDEAMTSKQDEPLNMKTSSNGAPTFSLNTNSCTSNDEITDFSPENLEKEEYFKNYVLECIDKLKERKARPDLDRIACLMKRLHNVPQNVTKSCLEYLAEAGAVVCVDYKGHISYRNPGKWRRTSVQFGVANGTSVSRKLIDAVANLISERTKMGLDPKEGVPYGDIERVILSNEGFDYPANQWKGNPELEELRRTVLDKYPPTLRLCIEREVMTGGLARTPEGNFLVDQSADKKRAFANILFNKKSPRPLHRITGQTNKASSSHSERSTSKSQTTKQVNIAPSVTTVKPTVPLTIPSNPLWPKRGRPPTFKKYNGSAMVTQNAHSSILTNPVYSAQGSGTSPMPTTGTNLVSDQLKWQGMMCCRCDQPSTHQDEFLQCTGCKITAHPSCLDYWSDLTARARVCGWECGDCKKCIVCADKSSSAMIHICDACDQGYHANCHKPVINDIVSQDSSAPWVCSRCKSEGFYLKASTKHPSPVKTDLNSDQPPVVMRIKKSPSPKKFLNGEYQVVDMSANKIEDSDQNPTENSILNLEHPVKKDKENTEPENVSLKERKRSSNSSATDTKDRLSLCANPAKVPKRPAERQSKKKQSEANKHKPNNMHVTEIADSSSTVLNGDDRPKDVCTWSVLHVKQWLVEQGYEKEGESFANEEIDGACLLLMKRMDLLTDLGIKLGPAVKIFERIKALQIQCQTSSKSLE